MTAFDTAWDLVKESAEGDWGFMNWPKNKPHPKYSSEALGNPGPPAGVTHLNSKGESEAWTILPNILSFFRNLGGRLDHMDDKKILPDVAATTAHENTHQALHSIGEIYGIASQDEYPAKISEFLVEMRYKYNQWKNGELPKSGNRRLIEEFSEGVEPEKLAMKYALQSARMEGNKQNIQGFKINHVDSEGRRLT